MAQPRSKSKLEVVGVLFKTMALDMLARWGADQAILRSWKGQSGQIDLLILWWFIDNDAFRELNLASMFLQE